ncbi:FG-GAP repeat domain-containing protein, partial [Hymenobacter agri]
PISPRATGLRLADVNGDGNLDAVSYALATLGGGVAVNLGTGQGTFLPKSQFSGGFTAATGDFNADGITDIVVGDVGGTNGVLRLVPGNTAGVFSVTASSFTTIAVQELGVADLDEDGDLDLLVSSGTQLAVYLNNGSGQFAAGASRPISQSYGGLTVGDFNGDGHADAVCASATSPDVSLLPGTGTGGLQP